MVLSATILSPSSETASFALVAETTITSYDENHAFLVAAPKTSTGAVTSLVRKPLNTRIPIVDVAAAAEVANVTMKLITAITTNRLGAFMTLPIQSIVR